MKKLLLLFLVPFFGFGQFQSENGVLYFEKVYEADSLSKSEIAVRAEEWIVLNFKNPDKVMGMKTEDKILANGVTEIVYTSHGVMMSPLVKYEMLIEFKDGRYRFSVTDFIIVSNGAESPLSDLNEMSYDDYKRRYEESMAGMDDNLRKYALKALKNEEKFKKMFEESMRVNRIIVDETVSNTVFLSEDLYSHITKKTNDDW